MLIVIMLMVGGMINAGELRWFILVPTIGQIIDVFQSVRLGINNAAEKPYMPSKGSRMPFEMSGPMPNGTEAYQEPDGDVPCGTRD